MAKFFLGDCREHLKNITPETIPLVATSPPYNAGKAYETALSLEEYQRFSLDWCSAVAQVLAPTGAFWLNLGYMKLSDTETLPLTYLYYPIIRGLGLHLIQEIVWHYEGGMAYKRRFSHRTERWQWWVRDPKNFIFDLDAVRDATLNRTKDNRNNPLGKNPTDYWYFDRVVGGCGASAEKTAHPCQFPVEMVERIVRACSRPGDVVLDPFGGSGSAALAAVRTGRDFIYMEIDPGYHRLAIERLAGGQ